VVCLLFIRVYSRCVKSPIFVNQSISSDVGESASDTLLKSAVHRKFHTSCSSRSVHKLIKFISQIDKVVFERKNSEETLKNARKRANNIFEQNPICLSQSFVSHDSDRRNERAVPVGRSILGSKIAVMECVGELRNRSITRLQSNR
jgi:hypothetical protein